MSIDVMVAVYRAKLGKHGTETAAMRKAVALKLADCAHDDGTSIHPSVKRIANECEISERSVQRVIGGFLDQKLLLIDNDGWSGKTNRYRFNFKILDGFPRTHPRISGEGDRVSPIATGGDKVTGKGDRVSPRGDPVSPEPSLNRQEPSKQRRARKSKSEKGRKMDVDPITGISATALAEGYALAEGWNKSDLLDKFLDLPEPNNPDAAWLGFCKNVGPHKSVKAMRFKSSATPEQPAAAKERISKPARIKWGAPGWHHWIDHLLKLGRRDLIAAIETAGVMDVPTLLPQPGALPNVTAPKRERVAA